MSDEKAIDYCPALLRPQNAIVSRIVDGPAAMEHTADTEVRLPAEQSQSEIADHLHEKRTTRQLAR